MKYLLAFVLTLILSGCLGSPEAPALPVELQNNPLNTQIPPVAADPLADLLPAKDLTPPMAEPVKAPNAETAKEKVNCEAIVTDLETSFADMNFCTTNDDCAVAAGSCPFGCFLLHHKKLDFNDYQPALTVYRENCNPCQYKCGTSPRPTDRRCKEGRCVDARFE